MSNLLVILAGRPLARKANSSKPTQPVPRSLKAPKVAGGMFVALLLLLLAPPGARGQDLQNGDLVVGYAATPLSFGAVAGGILRIRGAAQDIFCQSPANTFDPNYWTVPRQVVVDSQGRIVFFADTGKGGFGMFRCSTLGGAVENLAFFVTEAGFTAPAGYPVPFPNVVPCGYLFPTGLHLSKMPAIVINDSVNGGNPTVAIEDVYNFALGDSLSPSPSPVCGAHIYRLHTISGVWEVSQDPADQFPTEPLNMINHSGITFSVFREGANPAGCTPSLSMGNSGCDALRRSSNPLELKASGTIKQLNLNFSLDLSLFGGVTEVSGLILHDLNIPEVDSGCNAKDGISNLMPLVGNVFHGLSSPRDIVFDEFGSLGLVAESDSVFGGAPYLGNISQVLLDPALSMATLSQYFHDSFVGCAAVPTLQFTSILPLYDPASGFPNDVAGDGGMYKQMVSASGGLAGTQPAFGRVIGIAPGNIASVLASGIASPTGIGAYPNGVQPPLGVTLVIRADSPVNVLTTDPNGSRIGVDASGQAVNDFNVNGFDSGSGEPRFFAIKNAGAGAYSVQAVGTGSGSYTIHVYSANPSQAIGQQVVNAGIASPGSSSSFNFNLGADGTLTMAGTSGNDTVPPVTMASLSPQPNGAGWNNSNVTVTLTSTDNEPGGSGLKQITYSATGAQAIASTIVSGSSASVIVSNEGITNLSFFGTDNAGNVESGKSVTIQVDKTPPSVNCGAPDGLWHATDVSIACTASDSGSGLANATDASFSLGTNVPAGTETANAATGTHSVCDVAGNCGTAGPIAGNLVDKKPPSINISSPTAGGSYLVNQAVNASYSCTDGGSGVATCSGAVASGSPIDTTSVGSKTFTVNATDKVGNAAAAQSASYSVTYGLCILYDPTRAVQSGSTLPLKMQLCDANNADVSSSAVVVHGVGLVQASTNASDVLQASGNANPDNDFRFDSTLGPTGGYIFNLSTKGLTTGSYVLTFTAGADSASHTLTFQVR